VRSTARLDFKGWEGYNISERRQGASLLATGKLIKFLQAAWVSLRGEMYETGAGEKVVGEARARVSVFRPWEYCN